MRRSVTVVSLAALFLLGTLTAVEAGRGIPHRYAPDALDGRLAQIDRVEGGRTVAAWAYRNGAEYDIAISRIDENGMWTEPTFIGLDDGRDQIEPALAVDGSGNAYLVYRDSTEGRVLLSVLRADRDTWSRPLALTRPGREAASPALRVVANRLVVAFRVGDEVEILDLALTEAPGQPSLLTIVDHPDPVEYIPDPGIDSPKDGWDDGRWIIDDDDDVVDVMVPRRGPSETSGTPR